MLYDAEHVKAVVSGLKRNLTDVGKPLPPLVVDPVCVSTSGHRLLSEDAVSIMVEELFPLATLITPNKSEAEVLLAHAKLGGKAKIETVDDLVVAAVTLMGSLKRSVLLKGGHLVVTRSQLNRATHDLLAEDRSGLETNMEILCTRLDTLDEDGEENEELVVDVLADARELVGLFARPRIDSTSTHGTGCTLSSAIASLLAQGQSRMLPFCT